MVSSYTLTPMAERYELVWEGKDGAERSVPVLDVLTLGRGPRNDIVVTEGEVSWEHARLWTADDALFVADVGSTNGTYVDGKRVQRYTQVHPGATLWFGGACRMRVQRVERPLVLPHRRWIVEDLTSGIRRSLHQRMVVGDCEDADFRIEGAPRVEFVQVGEEVRLTTASGTEPLRAGQVVELPGLQLRVLEHRRQLPQRTEKPAFGPGIYHIDASLGGRSPVAAVYDDSGHRLVVKGETRATLLYVLAREVVDSRAAGAGEEEEGWLEDAEAVSRVWGRTHPTEVSNRLSVVVYRLRASLKQVGLSPSFIQRSVGRVRVRAGRVSLR